MREPDKSTFDPYENMNEETHPSAVLVDTFEEALKVWSSVGPALTEDEEQYARIMQKEKSYPNIISLFKKSREKRELLYPIALGYMWNEQPFEERNFSSLLMEVTLEEVIADFPLSVDILKALNYGPYMEMVFQRPHVLPLELQQDLLDKSSRNLHIKSFETALISLVSRQDVEEEILFQLAETPYGTVIWTALRFQ